MESSGNARTISLIIVVTLAFIVLAAATIVTPMLLTYDSPQSRGFMFWFITGFVCFIEFLFYVLVTGALAGRIKKVRAGGAIAVATWGLVGLYGFAGLTALIVYALVRDPQGPSDLTFCTIFGLITLLVFMAAAGMRAFDIWVQGQGQGPGAAAIREAHVEKARTLAPVIGIIKSVAFADPAIVARVDRLVKKLEGVEISLKHSHGGGIGSREAGFVHKLDPALDSQATNLIYELEQTGSALAPSGPDVDVKLTRAEQIANQLQGIMAAMGLR
ncbi:MAG: hypothetical protein HZA50_07490 [Planctomycetes bacterium]|nr:hypothetical protein [Planctomycetota bacterium]